MIPDLALTLHPEWAWAICHAFKRVENRSWHPGKRLPVGSRLAIHAGRTIRRASSVQGLCGVDAETIARCQTSAIVAFVTIAGFDRDVLTIWDASDQWHWRLGEVEVLDAPILCSGAQGLWSTRWVLR